MATVENLIDVNMYQQLKSSTPVAAISLHLLHYYSPLDYREYTQELVFALSICFHANFIMPFTLVHPA